MKAISKEIRSINALVSKAVSLDIASYGKFFQIYQAWGFLKRSTGEVRMSEIMPAKESLTKLLNDLEPKPAAFMYAAREIEANHGDSPSLYASGCSLILQQKRCRAKISLAWFAG